MRRSPGTTRSRSPISGGGSLAYVAVSSFTAYALAHNIGASVFSGAVVRYRAYSAKGLGVAEIGVLVAFCSFTFALGAVTSAAFRCCSTRSWSSATRRAAMAVAQSARRR